jgi:hypothetical protein
MNRATRPSRPGLTGSAAKSLLLSAAAGGVVLKAAPDTTTSTSLTWTEPEYKPDNYRVERSLDGTTFSTVTTLANTVFDYNDTGRTESTQYWYRIVPILGGADQPASNVADTWTVPATPTSLTATAVSSSVIDLAWTDVSTGNTGYVIEARRPPTTGTYAVIGTAGATATTFSATLLQASTAYEFRVAATNPATQSAYSNAATATTQSATVPNAPTGVSASASTTAVAVTITWTDASTDEDKFNVYRNTSNTTVGATLLNSPLAGIQTYTDNATNNPSAPPAIGTTYYYWVSASNGAGESAKTAASQNATGGVTTLNVPAAPTSLTTTGVSTTQIDLVWVDNATNETSYIVERRSPAGTGSYSQITSLAAGSTTFSNTGLTESTQYEYRVAAVNAAGNSAYSNASSKFTIPATPTGLTATATSSTQINLAWTDVSTGNTGQRIERRSPAGTGSYSTLTTVSATATTYSDTGLTASTQYEYRIIATNADYDSSPSTSASATTQSGALSPSWTLDFSSGTPSGYTLTRASTGTYVDSSGYIASASTDVARLTHNSSGSRLGLLVEQSRTNLFERSEEFGSAYWTAITSFFGTVTANTVNSPDNTTTADTFTESTSTGVQGNGEASVVITSGNTYTLTVFAKKGTATVLQLGGRGTPFGIQEFANFDLDNGNIGLVGTSVTGSDATITNVGNGWYRCKLTMVAVSNGTGAAFYCLTNNDANGTRALSYTGTSRDLYLWGAQLEEAATESSYIKTTTASVTRSADLVHVLDSSITSWGDPGALVVHFYPPGQAGTLISTDDASTAQVGIEASTTTAARAFWSSGSTATGTIGSGVQKAVHYWTGSTSKFCINGGTVQSGTNNFTIANADFVTLGAEATDSAGVPGTFSQYSNVIIRNVEFYSGTLTDGNLQTITT